MYSEPLEKQRDFFDKIHHQYNQARILNTSLHTRFEINEIIHRIGKSLDEYIADFGAGSGRIAIPLLQKGYKVHAIDVSTKSLTNLRSLAHKLHLISLRTTAHFPAGETFNHIVGADILHHVDLDEVIPQLWKKLKKGGRAIFSEPNAYHLAWYLYLPFASDWSIEKGILRCRYFHLIKKFKMHGFRSVSITGFGFLPTPLCTWSKKLCKLNNRLGNLPIIKLFAYRFIIEAVK